MILPPPSPFSFHRLKISLDIFKNSILTLYKLLTIAACSVVDPNSDPNWIGSTQLKIWKKGLSLTDKIHHLTSELFSYAIIF